MPKDPRIGRDSRHSAQNKRRQAEANFAHNDAFEPRPAQCMARRVSAEGVNQYVDVGQDHRSRCAVSTSSMACSEALSSRSMPGIRPPCARLTGGKTRCVTAEGRSFTTRRRPSSMRAVNERPSANALRLARRIRSSGRRTVVRSVICHDISSSAPSVN
jgi:hypothetical protein